MNNYRKILLAVTLLLTVAVGKAQVKISISGNGTVADNPSPQLEIDSAIYKVSYRMVCVPDTTDRGNKKAGQVLLFIGKNSRCLFIDQAEVEIDSIEARARVEGANPFSISTSSLKNKRVFKPIIAINYPEPNQVLYQEYGGIEKRYIDKSSHIEWNITDETEEVLGYNCRKATTHYRGRDYEAWYTEELPLGFGPYMFRGLPGLIFKIHDVEHDYEFSLVGFEKLSQPFVLTIDDYKVEMMSREEFRKLERARHEDPMISMSEGVHDVRIFNSDGKEIKSLPPRPYNPIERE